MPAGKSTRPIPYSCYFDRLKQNELAVVENVQEVAPAGTNSAQGGSEIKVEVVGGDGASLREFIKQWLVPGYPDSSFKDMTINIGSTPKDLPYDLPVPDDARTIGSISGGWVDYLLLFDTALDSNAINEFYPTNLKDKGWQPAPANQGKGGFVSQSDLNRGNCQADGKAYLSVETPSVSEGKTGIRLSLDTGLDPYMSTPALPIPDTPTKIYYPN